LLALFDIKHYINPALDSALYKKSAILLLPAPFTIALQKRYLKRKKALYKPIFVVVNALQHYTRV